MDKALTRGARRDGGQNRSGRRAARRGKAQNRTEPVRSMEGLRALRRRAQGRAGRRADKPDRQSADAGQATRRRDDNAPKQLSTTATRPRCDDYCDATATTMTGTKRVVDPTTNREARRRDPTTTTLQMSKTNG